jgi:hypothetical protein
MPDANDFFYLNENLVQRQKGVILAEGLGSLDEPINDGLWLLVLQHRSYQLLNGLAVQQFWVKVS